MEDNYNDTALVVGKEKEAGGLVDPAKFESWAEIFVKSGLFAVESGGQGSGPDINVQVAQAKVKILAGMEMGLKPFFAMQNLYVVKRHVFVSAAAFGALVNGNPTTKFITKESTAEKAVIEFYRKDGQDWELTHTQTYTMAEAESAGLTKASQSGQPSNYAKHPGDMLWNRCMTKGARKACPELVGGMKSVEEAHDDIPEGDFTESLIPEELPATEKVEEEKPAPQPKPRHRRTNAQIAADTAQQPDSVETVTPVEEPPQSDESGVVDDIPGEPELTSAEQDALDLPVTDAERDMIGVWYQMEKLQVPDIAKKNGWHITGGVGSLTHAQFLVLQAERRKHIHEASVEFGWGIADDTLDAFVTSEQRKQLQARDAKRMKSA